MFQGPQNDVTALNVSIAVSSGEDLAEALIRAGFAKRVSPQQPHEEEVTNQRYLLIILGYFCCRSVKLDHTATPTFSQQLLNSKEVLISCIFAQDNL